MGHAKLLAAVGVPEEERVRLIATASLVLDVLGETRAREAPGADLALVERWMIRVAGVRAVLDALTEWTLDDAYPVNALDLRRALGRLFPAGLDDADFDAEVEALRAELARAGVEPPA